jgi:hypothetical protein
MLPPLQLYKADSWTAAHQTKAMSEWIMPCLYHFKVSHMDGSTIISPIVPNSRQTPNISALCDTSETQWCGIRLQTAASKPHGPIPFGFPVPLQPSIPKSSPEGGKSSISHTDSLSTRNKPSISWRWLGAKVRLSRLYPMLLKQNPTPARLADEKGLRVIRECCNFATSSWEASDQRLRCSLLSWGSLLDDELPETAPLLSP